MKKIFNIERNYSNLNQRLMELMRVKNLTIHALAKKAGVAIGTIQKLISNPSCNPTISSIEAICNSLDISIGELIGQEEKPNISNNSSVSLLNWEDLPVTSSYIQNLYKNSPLKRETIKISFPTHKSSFALKMPDNSMLPLFPENTILIFTLEKTPKDGSYVLVHIHHYQKILFKQILIDEPFKYLISTNPLFKDNILKLGPKDKIIAVLVQSQIHH